MKVNPNFGFNVGFCLYQTSKGLGVIAAICLIAALVYLIPTFHLPPLAIGSGLISKGEWFMGFLVSGGLGVLCFYFGTSKMIYYANP